MHLLRSSPFSRVAIAPSGTTYCSSPKECLPQPISVNCSESERIDLHDPRASAPRRLAKVIGEYDLKGSNQKKRVVGIGSL